MAVVLIVLAMGVGLLRLAMIQLPGYQGEIQAWARTQLGIDLRFSRLDARWNLSGPELSFHDASLGRAGDEAGPIVSAAEARISLSAAALFSERRLEVSRLTLEEPNLGVERTLDGTLRLANLPAGPNSQLGFPPAGLPPVTVVISNGRVAYEDRIRQREWTFDDLQLELVWAADSVAVEARANAPEALGGRIDVSAQLGSAGPPGQGERDWRLFGEVRNLNLAELPALLPESLELPAAGEGDVSFWLDLTGDRARQATLALAFDGLRLGRSGGGDPAYERVGMTVEWSRLEAGWALSVSNLDLRRGGRVWPSGVGLDLRVGEDERGLSSLELRSGFLRLEDLSPLVSVLPASAAADLWTDLQPRGELSRVRLYLARGRESWNYSAAALLDELELASRGQWPELMGLSGRLLMDSRSGRLDLATRDARLQWPARFPGPLEADELTGRLTWRRGPEGLRVVGDDLVLNNRDGRSRSTLALTWPAGSGPPTPALTWLAGSGRPTLALESRVTDFDAASARRYFPMGVVPRVSAYLERAVLGGRVPQAEIVFFGPLTPSPFDDGEGRLRARVQVEEGSLAYAEGWPIAEDLNGVVEFVDASWAARGSGRVLGHRSEDLRADIEDVFDPLLTVAASTRGTLEDVLHFLQEAPLTAGQPDPDLQRLQAGGGAAEVAFELRLPMRDPAAYTLDAALEVADGELSVAGFGPGLAGVNGRLRLGDGGAISSEGIQATFLESPLAVRVNLADEPGYLADVAFAGETDVGALHEAFDLPFAGYALGRTRWAGNLLLPENRSVRARREPLRIGLESDLSGVELRLPEPLRKPPGDPVRLQVEFEFSEADRLNVSGEVGADKRFALSFRNRDGEFSFRRGSIRFGGALPLLPPRDGLSVGGALGTVRFDDWWAFFQRQVPGAAAGELLSADLEIADFSALGQPLGATELSLRQQAARWHLQIASEPVAGVITWPLDLRGRPQLLAEMERLHITPGPLPAAAEQDPRELPGVRLHADEFTAGIRRFGEFDADIRADPEGLRMVSFAARSETLAMEGSGGWFQRDQGPETRLVLTAASQDVARALEQLGFDAITEAQAAQVALNVYWPSPPSADWEDSISGGLNLRLEQGSILNLDPGAGRMVGLMSIAALPRRLALDFRDVFNRGLMFDEMSGDFVIIDGDAYTDNLHLTGPIVDIGMVGRTGLRDKDYEQHAVVTSEPGRILPTVGFLAGAQVGAALLIFSEIFREPLNGVGRASYCVTGSWSEPSVERLTPEQLQEDKLCADLSRMAALP